MYLLYKSMIKIIEDFGSQTQEWCDLEDHINVGQVLLIWTQ